MAKANFRVDPRLASLLGENYRSTEHAIRELVDNAWDADAENVRISIPAPMKHEPIVVDDDGCGMTASELKREYLLIGLDRRSRKGEKTPIKQRVIRGRKGIGKFAGMVYPFGGTSLGASDSMLPDPRPLAPGDLLCSASDRPQIGRRGATGGAGRSSAKSSPIQLSPSSVSDWA